jgi:hypothetical protein
MIFFYIDESGTSLNDPQSPYFVLAALALPADACRNLDTRVSHLKRELVSWAEPEDWEIKGRDMQRGQKFFKSVPWVERLSAIEGVARLIRELDAQTFAVQVDKREIARSGMTDGDLYRIALFRLLDELDAALARQGQPGMLLLDSRSDLHTAVQDRACSTPTSGGPPRTPLIGWSSGHGLAFRRSRPVYSSRTSSLT